MGAIVPSILVTTRREVEQKLKLIAGHTDAVQIDVVDGILAGPATWPYPEGGLAALAPGFDIHDMGDLRFEIDLMVREPEKAMCAFLSAGAARLVLHIESMRNAGAVIDTLEREYGRDKEFAPELLSLGMSVRIQTDLALLEPYLSRVDYVQFMGIAEIGRQGVPFDTRVLTKIREFRRQHADIPVQVDGGVSLTTAPQLFAAGASRLVVGSALWKSESVEATMHAFHEIAQEYGRTP